MGGDDELSFGQKVSNNWNGFKQFMWDGDAGTFMGRSGKSWAKIGLFYFIYYLCLAAFWAAMLFIFLQTLSYDKPKWTAYVSTPGLNYVPSAKEDQIAFTLEQPKTYERWTNTLTDIYESINATGQPKDGCTDDFRCTFDINQLGQVCKPPYFGYDIGKPCVLVNLNRVYNWEPQDYADGDIPEEIAADYVKGNIFIQCEAYKDKYKAGYKANETRVFPPQGIPNHYFPYDPKNETIGGKQNYATPWVAIQFGVKLDMDVKIACRSYTGNIKPKNGLFDTDQESKFAVEFHINPAPSKDEL